MERTGEVPTASPGGEGGSGSVGLPTADDAAGNDGRVTMHELGQFLPQSPSRSSLPSGILPSDLPHRTDTTTTPGLNCDIFQAAAYRKQVAHSGSGRHAVGDMDGVSGLSAPPTDQRTPICRDISFSEMSRKCNFQEVSFFNKVRKSLRSPEVYNNFLRCLTLYTQEIVTKAELLTLVTPFLRKCPYLLLRLTNFLDPTNSQLPISTCGSGVGSSSSMTPTHSDGISLQAAQRHVASSNSDSSHVGDLNDQEIDFSSCRRVGTSYYELPQSKIIKKCSGRTPLCSEVLNDKWISYPKDASFDTLRKTRFEETLYRIEDERFELDMAIETNRATIRVLEGVQSKMSSLSSEELARYHLDDYLGGTSQSIHQKAIYRIHGDKASEIIQGLKEIPSVAVPVVLKRLKIKDAEWRTAKEVFNKQWREQNEKCYLKYLSRLSTNFKQQDMKGFRAKNLLNEIETLYDERHDQENENGEPITGPHLTLPYKDKTILGDAAKLLIHHVKRQTGIQKQEKTKIKDVLRQFVPDLFFSTRQPLSEDEREDGATATSTTVLSSSNLATSNSITAPSSIVENENIKTEIKLDTEMPSSDIPVLPHALSTCMDEAYTLFYANNDWYLFFRLHAILCERLRTMYDRAQLIAVEEKKPNKNRCESVAQALRLTPKSEVGVEDYYPTFLDMLKNKLDGNMDTNTFENEMREMFDMHAYISFTLDKIVSNAVTQLQNCVTKRTALECFEMFHHEQKRGAAGGLCHNSEKIFNSEMQYHNRAREMLHEENCFKIYIYKIDCRVTIELLNTGGAL